MTVTLVPARPNDAKACADAMSDWVAETAWMPRLHSRDGNARFLGRMIGYGWVTVARKEGAVAGFLIRDGEEVHALYLFAAARGQGIGKALLDRAKAGQRRLGLWCFQSNIAAQRFYLREGFVEVERTDGAGNDEKLPDIRYEWRSA